MGPHTQKVKRNEAVHWDFLFLGEGFGNERYVLVVKDSLTHYCELFSCSNPTAYVAAEGLLSWYKRYGCPTILMSDQGTHFRNSTVDHLCARLKIERRFSPVYSPWLNGTVERLNRDVLRVLRVLLAEYRLDYGEWPYLLPVVQANLNFTPVRSLGDHSPLELFTGLTPPSSLDVIVVARSGGEVELEVDVSHAGEFLEHLRESLHGLHREVVDIKERKRLHDMVVKKGSVCNFDIGDYVLWSRVDQRLSNNKLLVQWVGPFMVTEAMPHSFRIKHLVTDHEYEVHASRLKFYADRSLNVTEEIKEFVTQQGMVLGVAGFKDHRFNDSLERWELLVSWSGLQTIEDSWESLATMIKDVPQLVRN